MKIWIFNHYAVAPGQAGGTRHFDLAKNIVESGDHQVTIFASSFSYQKLEETIRYSEKEYTQTSEYSEVFFRWIKTHPYKRNDLNRVWNIVTYAYRAYQLGKRLEEKPDVIIGSLVHPLAALVGYWLAKKKGSIFYFEERDLWPQTLIDLGKISPKNPVIFLLSWLEKFLYKKASRIIVLFDKAVDYVQSRGIQPDKVMHLPNGVDLARYESAEDIALPEELENIFQSLSGKFIGAYLGSHGLANHLDALLDAANRLRDHSDIHFLLIGDGPEKERLMKRKTVEELHNVTFFPSIKKEYVPVVLKRVHVGLLPLKNSPVFKWGISPNKLFDYMASELPVILLCDLDGTPVEASGGGIVVKTDFAENLAKGMLQLSASPAEAKRLGKKAKEYVYTHHAWHLLSAKLLAAMEEDVKSIKRTSV